jgi:hypothetical protein
MGPAGSWIAIGSSILFNLCRTEAESRKHYVIHLTSKLLSEDTHGLCRIYSIIPTIAKVNDGDGDEEGVLVLEC